MHEHTDEHAPDATAAVHDSESHSSDVKVYEVEFKGSRRDFFLCPDRIQVKPLDFLIVQADRGEHIGRFIRYTDKDQFDSTKDMKSILRRATYTDIQIMMDNRHKEEAAFDVCRKKIVKHDLNMKLVDVEYQFDGNKICFYFTADKRVDFRELVKDLAAEYRTRIELRQIGVRDEARRLGGLGVCGRQLCCKTFLCEFEPITSQMARDQNLSLSPSKISGLCGRLMCCLAFEEDFYRDQASMLPDVGARIEQNGTTYDVTRIDIFEGSFTIRTKDGTEKTVTPAEFTGYKVVRPAARNHQCNPDCKQCGEKGSENKNGHREKNNHRDKPNNNNRDKQNNRGANRGKKRKQ